MVPSFGFFLSVRFTELAKKSFRALLCSILFSAVHGIRTHNESFFKYSKEVLRYLRVLLVVLSAQILSLCIPVVCDFALLSHFFCKKLGFYTFNRIFYLGLGYGFGL